MKIKNIIMLLILLISVYTIAGCASGNEDSSPKEKITQDENTEMDHSDAEHADMDHSSTGEVPEGLQEAENPTYEVGSKAIITEGHMAGMKGAEATIVGAYDTIAYAISYAPTNGGERVTNHKWVIHEEIQEASEEPFEQGTEVTVEASHMAGMEGATAEIDSAENTTVYMINFTPTTGGEEVTNHKWVTESELSQIEHH
ncbi:YdhK family protein [Alkalihalobacillus deserti]|uniref:YdhK family protein n=1 Tax=Alkalihalobacillus deserti TaxID=2879466 RepID=UPI001D1412D1|nr:YdhK family protein [Alkalihalobacillus deserti]